MLFGFVYSPKQKHPGEDVIEIKTAVCGRDTVEAVMNRIGFRTVATRTDQFNHLDELYLFYGRVAGIGYPIAWLSESSVNTGSHTVLHVARWKKASGKWEEDTTFQR